MFLSSLLDRKLFISFRALLSITGFFSWPSTIWFRVGFGTGADAGVGVEFFDSTLFWPLAIGAAVAEGEAAPKEEAKEAKETKAANKKAEKEAKENVKQAVSLS